MPDFELTKWYADCVSERGDACIQKRKQLLNLANNAILLIYRWKR